MNKLEFLEILERELKALPQEEYENVLAYYREYFEEAGIEKESEVIAELGDPYVLAERILGENRIKKESGCGEETAAGSMVSEPQTEKSVHYGWIAVIAVLGFPVWIVAAALIFSAIVVMGALIFGLGLGAGLMVLIGAIGTVFGFIMTFAIGATSLFIAGMSLLVAGLGFLLYLAVLGICKAFGAFIDKLVQIFSRRRAAA